MKHFFKFIALTSLCLAAASCAGTKQIAYFQNTSNLSQTEVSPVHAITAQPTDKLLIVVTSKDPTLASIFNLPVVSMNLSNINSGSRFAYAGNNNMATYTVDANGCIDFPILGKILVKDMKREEIASSVKNLLISGNYLKDPVVTVEFSNSFVTVLGDVSKPGKVTLSKDKVTILEVLGEVGDLSITGLRQNVKVFREEGGKQVCYALDMTDANSIFQSPVYYVQQNDVVYVTPNKMKKRQSTSSGNQLLTPSFWISVVSMLTSVTTTVVAIRK